MGEPLHSAGIMFRSPFPFRTAENVIIIDCETQDGLISVLGYYRVGDRELHQIAFPRLISPSDLVKTTFFRRTFLSGARLAAYNVSFESELLGISPDMFIELQPLPYLAKEDLISVSVLDQKSSKQLPQVDPAKPEALARIVRHNHSCLVKEFLIYYLGDLLAVPDFLHTFEQGVLRHLG